MTANAPKDVADEIERVLDGTDTYDEPGAWLVDNREKVVAALRSTPEALNVEEVARAWCIVGMAPPPPSEEDLIYLIRQPHIRRSAEAVLALLTSTRPEPSEPVQEMHKLEEAEARKCGKSGCGALRILGHPCTDWDCPQRTINHSDAPELEARGFAAGIEAAAACADQWGKSQELRLRCGEMKAQELRTAVAVAKGIASAIRAHTPASHLSATTEETTDGR